MCTTSELMITRRPGKSSFWPISHLSLKDLQFSLRHTLPDFGDCQRSEERKSANIVNMYENGASKAWKKTKKDLGRKFWNRAHAITSTCWLARTESNEGVGYRDPQSCCLASLSTHGWNRPSQHPPARPSPVPKPEVERSRPVRSSMVPVLPSWRAVNDSTTRWNLGDALSLDVFGS